MSCRCGDIRDCQHDIGVVNEILSDFENARSIQHNVSNKYTELARISQRTFITNNMPELNDVQSRLNETLVEEIPKLISECNEKIQQLHIELAAMISEDVYYHSHHDD